MNISVSRKGTGAEGVRGKLARIEKQAAYVGIPQKANARKGEPIGNAALLYIHSHGSPARNLPARAVIEPAIAASGNKEAIVKELEASAKANLNDAPVEAMQHLRRAGQVGANVSKAWFTDPRNNWPPNASSTIREKGSDRPLIDTGALRRAITFVVRESK